MKNFWLDKKAEKKEFTVYLDAEGMRQLQAAIDRMLADVFKRIDQQLAEMMPPDTELPPWNTESYSVSTSEGWELDL